MSRDMYTTIPEVVKRNIDLEVENERLQTKVKDLKEINVLQNGIIDSLELKLKKLLQL